MNVFNVLLSVLFAIFTFMTMRLLAPLQHCEQYMCTTCIKRISLIALPSETDVFTLAAPQQLRTAYTARLVALRGTWQLISTVHIRLS